VRAFVSADAATLEDTTESCKALDAVIA